MAYSFEASTLKLHDEPTERDRQDDLKRQYANFQRDPAVVIFCPWCMKGNKGGEPACCAFFTEGVENVGREQMAFVEKQFREARLGSHSSVQCPYCATWNKKPEPGDGPEAWMRPYENPWCCNMMSDCVTALAERLMSDRLAEKKARIEDKVSAN